MYFDNSKKNETPEQKVDKKKREGDVSFQGAKSPIVCTMYGWDTSNFFEGIFHSKGLGERTPGGSLYGV